MAIKIGINGFGRIGRVVLRILAEQPDKYEVCGINLRKADVDYMVYLLKYDSVFRRFNGTVEHEGGDLVVNGHKIRVFSQSDAAMIPWSECGAEYIIESTGANNTTEKASRHFKGGAKKVLLIRILLPQPIMEQVDVVHHRLPGAAVAEIHRRAALRQGLAVAQVVVSRHQDAPVVEIPGKIVIPQDVLRHAVGDL